MADPFGVLWAPVTPADPDPGFAARLRARLERALDLPEGVVVSERPPHPAPVAATRRRGVGEPAADESDTRARSVRRPRQGDIGYASAIGWMLVLIIAVVSLIQLRLTLSREEPA